MPRPLECVANTIILLSMHPNLGVVVVADIVSACRHGGTICFLGAAR